MRKSLADIIRGHAARIPDRPAFLVGDTSVSWAQYAQRAERFARFLLGLGLAPGEHVAVLSPNGPGVHIAWLGAELAGLVVVAIGDRVGFRELEHALRISRATCLISRPTHQSHSMVEFVRELGTRGVALRHCLTTDGEFAQDQSVLNHGVPVDVDAMAQAVDANMPASPIAPSELFLLNFTSGTTGMPKCVTHHQQRWFSFHTFAEEAGALCAADVFMSLVPTPFGFGIWTSHFTPTILGAPTVLMPHFSVDEAIAAIERYRVTVLAAVTTQFIMMLNAEAFQRHDLRALRVLFTGGEPVSAERAAEFEERTDACVLQFYGSNEVGAVSRTSHRDTQEKRLKTAGRVIEEMNVRLFDEKGNDVTVSGRGQPGCKGPTLSRGYYGDEAANAKLIRKDGWMMLGDVVEIDAEGYLRVIGRTDDFIIRGGKNISGPAVEQQVATHPAVALVAAVAIPDPVFGERVCACVELHPGASLDLKTLVSHLAARNVTKETWPERLAIFPTLPRNSGGKVAKQELHEEMARRVVAERDGA